jgi:hypothetical protein
MWQAALVFVLLPLGVAEDSPFCSPEGDVDAKNAEKLSVRIASQLHALHLLILIFIVLLYGRLFVVAKSS